VRHARVARVVALSMAVALVLGPAAAYADNESDVASETAAVPVATPGTITALTPAPVIVVRSYTTSPSRITAGVPFDLTITVYNATGRRADNVVVSLGQPAAAAAATPGGLTVLGTGNAKYLGALRGQREGTVTFTVIASPGTTPGALTVPVTVSFEHQDARQEVAYTIGALVERDALLSLVTAELPDSVVEGETFEASFEVANASAFALAGVTLSVEATGAAITDGSIFLGTMDAATTETLDVTITAEKAGPLEVTVVLAYRDDFGRAQAFRETRTVQVEAVDEPTDPGEEAPAPEDGDNWFIKFIKSLFGIG